MYASSHYWLSLLYLNWSFHLSSPETYTLYVVENNNFMTFFLHHLIVNAVEPHLADTPEMQTSTVMRTLHVVPKVFRILNNP